MPLRSASMGSALVAAARGGLSVCKARAGESQRCSCRPTLSLLLLALPTAHAAAVPKLEILAWDHAYILGFRALKKSAHCPAGLLEHDPGGGGAPPWLWLPHLHQGGEHASRLQQAGPCPHAACPLHSHLPPQAPHCCCGRCAVFPSSAGPGAAPWPLAPHRCTVSPSFAGRGALRRRS